ncbi:hypothetical protein PPROV_000422500 [Pycnococcus provasolii]|uniref:L-serine ammonia-lyase n=1 Tax=Pycnococcus provasolii TaxID=41880 RepID=A0A830HEN9_9CHLO|nr:hypothetical protein PPROV_000422500 [Pycnococcus provasolii]
MHEATDDDATQSVSVSHASLYARTPCFRSAPISTAFGGGQKECDVFLKMETGQPSGSFKLRGVSLSCLRAKEQGYEVLISSSGGNAGLAVAVAGQSLGLPVQVFLPKSTPDAVADALRGYGAQVKVEGDMWSQANDAAMREVERRNDEAKRPVAKLMHPFDDPIMWEGHATLIEECYHDMSHLPPPSAVVCSVGGGGLLMGVLAGLKNTPSWSDVPVIAVETVGANCLSRSLDAKGVVELDAITSVAKSLGANKTTQLIYDTCASAVERGVLKSAVIDDAAAVQGAVTFLEAHRCIVEPACGAAVAATLPSGGAAFEMAKSLHETRKGPVLVVACGGAVATVSSLRAMATDLGVAFP